MKQTLIAAALFACCIAGAQAQTANAGAGAVSGSAAQSGSASNSGAVSTVIVEASEIPTATTSTINQNVSGTQTVRNVPAIAMSGPASGPCTGLSGGVSVAVPGAGVGINAATVSEGCEERETARIYAMMGEKDKAMQILDNTEAMLRTQAKIKARQNQPPAAAPKAAAPTGAGVAVVASNNDAALCDSARAKDDKALAARVCR